MGRRQRWGAVVGGLLMLTGGGIASAAHPVSPPGFNQPVARTLGLFAWVQDGALWATGPADTPIRVAAVSPVNGVTPAVDPTWSPDGRYLAYLEPEGSENAVGIFVRGSGQHYLLQPTGPNLPVGLAWAPEGDRLSVAGTKALQILAVGPRHAALTHAWPGNFMTPVWDTRDASLLAVQIAGSLAGGQARARIRRFALLDGRWTMTTLLASKPGAGLLLAAVSPDGRDAYYWPDPMFSASLLADGAPLMALNLATGTVKALAATLPSPQFIRASRPGGPMVIQVGGPRPLFFGKALALITGDATVRPLRPPTGAVWIEPDVNEAGTRIAFVAAKAYPNRWGGMNVLKGFTASRHLMVWAHPGTPGTRPVSWTRAGSGVTDPLFVPGHRGILYLVGATLYWIAGQEGHPVRVLGPVTSLGPLDSYYGQINWTAALGWLPR